MEGSLNTWKQGLFAICTFTFTLVFWMVLAFLPIHLARIGIPSSVSGVIMGTYSLGGLGFIIPFGMLADRFSPKRILYLGIAFVFTHIVGLKIANSSGTLLLCAFLGGLGLSIFQIVLFSLYLKVIPENGKGLRISTFQMGFFLGFGVGPLVGGTLWEIGGYDLILSVSLAAVLILVGLFVLLPDSQIYAFSWKDYKQDVVQKKTILFLAVYFVYGMHFGVEQTGFSILMKKELGFGTKEIGMVYMAVGLWMALLSPFTGHSFDVQKKITPFLIGGLLVSAAFHIATPFAKDLGQMVAVRILHTLGDTPAIFSMGMLTAMLFPQGRMGGNSAVVYSIRTVGIFTGNVFTGILAGLVGYKGAFVYSGLFFLFATLCFWPLVSEIFGDLRPASHSCE